MIAVAAALVCASAVRLGPDVVDLFWVRAGKGERVLRLGAVPEPILGGSAVAVREGSRLHVLPGDRAIRCARAAAFSQEGKLAVALFSGKIVEGDRLLGRMAGVERLAFGRGVVAAGKGGALLLPKLWLTREPVRALAARGDRIALATAKEILVFDGDGQPLRKLKARASLLALSPAGRLAWASGREVRMLDADQPMAREHDRIEQLVFEGERLDWLARGGHRWDGASLDCAGFLDGSRGLLATCPHRVVDWSEPARDAYTMNDCNAHLAWAVPLGDGILVAVVLRDRRFSPGCEPVKIE